MEVTLVGSVGPAGKHNINYYYRLLEFVLRSYCEVGSNWYGSHIYIHSWCALVTIVFLEFTDLYALINLITSYIYSWKKTSPGLDMAGSTYWCRGHGFHFEMRDYCGLCINQSIHIATFITKFITHSVTINGSHNVNTTSIRQRNWIIIKHVSTM
jgi:hypothetical protein